MKKTPNQTPPARNGKTDQSPLAHSTPPAGASEFPLPAPMDLAKLAAILEPKAPPEKAMRRAMEFLVEATYFLKDCPRSAREIIRCFGSVERYRALHFVCDPALSKDTLELHESKGGHDADPARKYLSEQGLELKTARAVINNWRLWQPRNSKEGKEEIEMEIQSCQIAKGIYAIPRGTLQAIASDNKRRRTPAKEKGWQTRRAASKTKSPKNTGV